jgi:RNA-directed DNA polymerase
MRVLGEAVIRISIRQAARERPKERLTALYHHVTIDLLHAAYAALRRETAAGVDLPTF